MNVLRIAQETVKKTRAQNFLLFYNERLHCDLFLRNQIGKIVFFFHFIWELFLSTTEFFEIHNYVVDIQSPNQETGLGNRGHLKVLSDAKKILNN